MKETTFSVLPTTASPISSADTSPITKQIDDKPASYATLSGLAQRLGSGNEWQTDKQFFALLKVAGESTQFVEKFDAINEPIFCPEKEVATAHTLQQRMAAQHLSDLQLENIRGFILEQFAAAAGTDIAAGNSSLATHFLQTFSASELPVLQEYRKQGFNYSSLNLGGLAGLLNSPGLAPEASPHTAPAEAQGAGKIRLSDAVRDARMDVGTGAAALMQALMTSWDALQHYPGYAEMGQDLNQVIAALTTAAAGLESAGSLFNPETWEAIESASKNKLIDDAVEVLLASGKAAPGQEEELRAEVENALEGAKEDMVAEIGQLRETAIKRLRTELSGQIKLASAETSKGVDQAERIALKLSRMANTDGAKGEKDAINTLVRAVELTAIGLKDAGKILGKMGSVTEPANELLKKADAFLIKLGDGIAQNPSSTRLKLDAWANRVMFEDTGKELAAMVKSVAKPLAKFIRNAPTIKQPDAKAQSKARGKMADTLAKVINTPPTMKKLDAAAQPLMDGLADRVAKPLTKIAKKLGEGTDGLLHLAAGGVSKVDIKISKLQHGVAQIAEPASRLDKVADNAIRSASLRLLGNTQKIKDLSGKLLAAAKEAGKLQKLSAKEAKQAEKAEKAPMSGEAGASKIERGEAGLRAVLETAAEGRPKAAPKKSGEESAAALKEQAAAALNMAKEVLSQADDATLVGERNAALDNVPLHLRKQTELRLDSAIKPLKQTVPQLKAAAEMLKQAAQMAEKGPEKAKEAADSALKAMQYADIAKREIKTTLANVTGSPLHNFTLDGRTAKGLGECADETIKDFQKMFPEIDADEIKTAMAQVLKGVIGLDFTKEKDPDGVLMAKRVELALEDVRNGTMVWPPTPDEILNQTPGTREYLEKLGVKKLTGMGVLAAGAKAFIPELLSRMFGFDPKLSGVVGLIRGLLSPLEVYCQENRMMQGVKPGGSRPDPQIAEGAKRLYAKAVVRISVYLLSRPLSMAVAAAATASGYYRAEDHGAFIKKAVKRAVLQEVPFAGINLAIRAGVKANATARAEAAAAPGVHKMQDAINATLASEHKAAQLSALVNGLEAGTLSDTESTILRTELKKMGLSDKEIAESQELMKNIAERKTQLREMGLSEEEITAFLTRLSKGEVTDAELDAINNFAMDPVRAGRQERGLFSTLASVGSSANKPIEKVDIVTEFTVKQAKNELNETLSLLSALSLQQGSLLNDINHLDEGVVTDREAKLFRAREQYADITDKITVLKEKAELLKTSVKSLEERFDALEVRRKSWDPLKTSQLLQHRIMQFNEGALIRMSDRLSPETFVRNYVRDILKKFPKGDCGSLISPDSEITVKGIGSNSAGGTKKITLMDLAKGKIAITDWDIKWEKNVSMDLREALNPGGSNIVPEGGGGNLGTNWYTSKKTRPDSLTVQLTQAFKKSIDEIRNNQNESESMAIFHDSMFKVWASEIKSSPALADLFNKYVPGELTEYKEFLQKLDDIESGKEAGEQVSFKGKTLTDVVAVRVNNKILAIDIKGGFILIDDTNSGLQNKKMQDWVISKLDANSQYEYRTGQSKEEAFLVEPTYSFLGRSSRRHLATSPIQLTQLTSLGEGISKNILQRAEDDMDSLVKTSREYLSEKMLELSLKFVGTGASIGIAMAGGAAGIHPLWVTLGQIAMVGKLTVEESLMMYVLADSQQEKDAILANIPEKLLTAITVESGMGLGLPLAKKMIPTLKFPWKVDVKDINPMKEGVNNIVTDSLSSRVSPMTTEFVNKLKQPTPEHPKTEPEPLKPLEPLEALKPLKSLKSLEVLEPEAPQPSKTPEASKTQEPSKTEIPKPKPLQPGPVIIGTIWNQTDGVTGQSYEVQEGDNLYSIMVEQGIDPSNWKKIIEANSYELKSPSDITPGQVLIIPDELRIPVDRVHTTEAGDNLQDLSYKYYGFYGGWNYILLTNLNAEKVPFIDNTQPDIELNLPNSLFNGTFNVPDFLHRVQPGQTLEDLAYLYYDSSVGLDKLRDANPGIKEPLVPGTVLNISKYVYPKYFGYADGRHFDVSKGLVKEESASPPQDSPAVNLSGRSGGGFFGTVKDDANENLHVRARINPVVTQNNSFVGQKYIVQPGDTFHDITNAFGIRPAQYAEFIALNKDALSSVTALPPGKTLLIPDTIRYVKASPPVEGQQAAGIKKGTQQDTAESRSMRSEAVSETDNLLRGRRYTVQQGDTLESIATRNNIPHTKIGLLTQANRGKLLPGNDLKPGTDILIPESARNKKDILKPEIKHRPYTIQPGDSLVNIVFRFYGNYDHVSDVVTANAYKWVDGKMADPGAEIMLLKSKYDGNYSVATIEHTVKAGDTVEELSQRYYDSPIGEEIIRTNNPGVDLSGPLKEGIVLIIPDSVQP